MTVDVCKLVKNPLVSLVNESDDLNLLLHRPVGTNDLLTFKKDGRIYLNGREQTDEWMEWM
jgi:hypothetical protein